LVPAGKEAERLAAIRAAYREALAKLSGGFQQEAATALTGIERAEAKASEDVLLELLRRAELEVARQLADEDPSALIPVMLLHEGTYLTYRERDERIVARHGREMVRELAELYVRSGGEPTSVAASVFTSLGGSLQQAGLTTSANSLFERALDLDRANEGALLSLAVYYEKVGLYERAVSYLERLTEARPGIGEAWLRLGVNLQRLGKREEARRWLAQARGPEAGPWVRSLAYQELASTSIAEQDLAGAEALLREGLDQLPGDQRLILQLCLVLDRRGRAAAARALLEGLEPEAPGEDLSPRYLYNRWPIHVIETGRRELASTAVARLPVLARVISGLARTEWSR
jgi:tetratricopeptide (TPR) repeat protein